MERRGVAVRRGTAADGGGPALQKVENATAVIWKTLLIAEKTFRLLDAAELLADVANGVVYVNGVRAVNQGEKKAARLISFTHFLTEPQRQE